jgi:hypothetical protein
MHNPHDLRARNALWRLSTVHASAGSSDLPALVFLKTPAIVGLWLATLVAVTSILALGRVQVPRVARGVAVTVRAESGDTALLLLLPPSARAYVQPGQQAKLDTGYASTMLLTVKAVDTELLSASTARQRFAYSTSLIGQLDVPKLVVRLSPCEPHGCLTPTIGEAYAATMLAGTRSIASYALSGS